MEKIRITNDNGESSNTDEQGNEVNENYNCNRTLLSRWHNEIIVFTAIGTLIVTFALATITYYSLREVKDQRDLTYKQFVMANRPNLNFGFEDSGLVFKDKRAYFKWKVRNDGGDVEDLIYQSVLFHVKSVSKSDYVINEFYVRNIRQYHLSKGIIKSIHNKIEDVKTLTKIKKILSSDNKTNVLGLFIRAEYTIPAELTIDGTPEKDSRFQILAWDVINNRFEDINIKFYEKMMEKISEKKFETLNDQG